MPLPGVLYLKVQLDLVPRAERHRHVVRVRRRGSSSCFPIRARREGRMALPAVRTYRNQVAAGAAEEEIDLVDVAGVPLPWIARFPRHTDEAFGE